MCQVDGHLVTFFQTLQSIDCLSKKSLFDFDVQRFETASQLSPRAPCLSGRLGSTLVNSCPSIS
jgi:hypothetical protein